MTTKTQTLADFLLARITEDEACLPQGHDCWYEPARYAAECDAKRRIVGRARMVLDSWHHNHGGDPRKAPFPDVNRRERDHAFESLYDLAIPYADHPDYRPGWRV